MGRRAAIGEKAEDIVLNAISLSHENGITKSKLLSIVAPLDQSTVYRITSRLEKKGLIKIIRNGQRTRYIALRTPQRDLAVEGFLFGNSFTDLVLGSDRLISFDLPLEDPNFKADHPDHPDYKDYKDYRSYTHYFSTKFKYGSLEDKIFEFVNQIGGYILSVFLDAMDHSKLNRIQNTPNDNLQSLVMPYVTNAVGSQLLRILWQFWVAVNRWKRDHDMAHSINEKFQIQRELGIMLEGETSKAARKILAKMYPRLNRRLVDLRKGITDTKKAHFKSKHLQMLEREQETSGCTHTDIKWKKEKVKPHSRGKLVVKGRCSRCKRWITWIEQRKEPSVSP